MLSIRQLRVQYKTRSGVVRAVNNIDLDVATGETLALVGESGCGKSAACLAIMGLLPEATGTIENGSIRLGDQELVGLGEREYRTIRGNQMAMISQNTMTALNPYLRIETQVLEGLYTHMRCSKRDAMERAVLMLGQVGLPDAANLMRRYPHELSGGMRQRVQIGMSLLCEPQVLIADEPTTALDVRLQRQIIELLADLQATMGLAMILVSHDLGLVARVADRVAVMYAGEVVETGPTQAIIESPRHPYTQCLREAIPRLERPRDQPLTFIPGSPPTMMEPIEGCAFAPRCPQSMARCAVDHPHLSPSHTGQTRTQMACWLEESERR